MINKIDEFTKADMRLKFRRMYWDLKLEGCVQVMYELLESANILAEVVMEENAKEQKEGMDA